MEKRNYEIRASEKPLVVEGMAIVFDAPAKVGGYTERIAPGALDGVSLDDVTLLINHDGAGIPLARSPKTLTLSVTNEGLAMRAELPDTEQGRGVYEAIRRGDLAQMSFAFDIGTQERDEKAKTATITEISAVYEISIVNRAAYPQTNIQAREAQKEQIMSTFNQIESAVFGSAKVASNADTHATPEYRTAFFKSLLGQPLTETETRAYAAATTEKRADVFNTLTSSAAVVPTQTLNEIIAGPHTLGGLYNEIRMFSVPANLSIPVGTPTDPAQWHVEGAAVDRKNLTTSSVTFSAFELIKVLSLSAAAKRMTLAAFEAYLTDELRKSITDALNAAIITGTGTGQPKGILPGITWNATNSLSGTIADLADNLLAAIAKLAPGYVNGAKFAMSTATLFGSIYPIKDGNGLYIFTDTEKGGVRRLFGFEIVLDDNLPAGTILFGNFKYYGVNVPEGILVETSRDSGFTSGLIDFRALCIADAKPIVPEAFVKLTVTSGT